MKSALSTEIFTAILPVMPTEALKTSLFGEKLRELRQELHLTQAQLSEKLGLELQQVSRYETGRVAPSVEVIAKLARIFNVSTDFLLLDDAPRTTLRVTTTPVIERLQQAGHMNPEEERALLLFVEAIEAKNKLKTLATAFK